MKKTGFCNLFLVCFLTGCKIEYNSPQTARDDDYGTSQSSIEENTSEKTTSLFPRSGIGDSAIVNISLKKGPVLFFLKNKQGKTTISLLDSDGQEIQEIFNVSGVYEGSVVAIVPKDADNYILSIRSTNQWTIEMGTASETAQ